MQDVQSAVNVSKTFFADNISFFDKNKNELQRTMATIIEKKRQIDAIMQDIGAGFDKFNAILPSIAEYVGFGKNLYDFSRDTGTKQAVELLPAIYTSVKELMPLAELINELPLEEKPTQEDLSFIEEIKKIGQNIVNIFAGTTAPLKPGEKGFFEIMAILGKI